jgi:hypothetical protein
VNSILKPVQSNSHPMIYFNIILSSCHRFSNWCFPRGFPTKILYAVLVSSIWVTYQTCHNILDLITLIVTCELYKLKSCCLCIILQFCLLWAFKNRPFYSHNISVTFSGRIILGVQNYHTHWHGESFTTSWHRLSKGYYQNINN